MDGYVVKPANRLLLVGLALWAVTLVVGIPIWLKGDVSPFRGGKSAGPVTQDDLAKYDPKIFTSDDGRFSAEFPSKPTRTVATGTTTEGEEYEVVTFMSKTADHGVLAVKYRDYEGTLTDSRARAILSEAPSAAVADGVVESRAFVTAFDSPGVDFKVTSRGEKFFGRIFVAGTENPRLYTLLAWPDDYKKAEQALERLIETFTLQD